MVSERCTQILHSSNLSGVLKNSSTIALVWVWPPSAPFLEGSRYGESGPEITYNLWADYKFFKNFGAGAGFNGQSKYDTMVGYKSVTGSFYIPAYTIFNASLYYENDTYRVSIKANNITDEIYYSGWSTITPQQRRMLLGTFTYKF